MSRPGNEPGAPARIPVVILHRDEPDFLAATITALRARTHCPHALFVVDNHSMRADSHALLAELEAQGIHVVRNRTNRWVLGFNSALDHPAFDRKAPFYVFSDGDIVVPEPDAAGACWLDRLVRLMEAYPCAGKIGLALNLDYVAQRDDLRHIHGEELAYAAGERIGELVIAPVDTTLAIYRPTAFMTRRFQFLPGHKSLLRPYLYSFRTPLAFSAEHLGWTKYGAPRADIGEKIRCFSRYGGYVDRVTLAAGGLADRVYYRVAGPMWRLLWGVRVAAVAALYVVARFPRRMNELQHEARVPRRQALEE